MDGREMFGACVKFHGHICPGLALGYKASIVAVERLLETRAEDEELLAIVENDSCFVDAVQVITGCTFGKGNLIFRDYGKMVLTLASRRTKRAIRVSMKGNPFHQAGDTHLMQLFERIRQGTAGEDERTHFRRLQAERSERIMAMEPEQLFQIREIELELQEMARLVESETCALCGEPTMRTKLVDLSGKRVCRACAAERQPYRPETGV